MDFMIPWKALNRLALRTMIAKGFLTMGAMIWARTISVPDIQPPNIL